MLRSSFALASLGLVSSLQAGDTFFMLDGPASNAMFGHSLATGDLDNDGLADIVVGAPNSFASQGMTRAYSGRTGAQLFALAFAKYSGTSVASGGDVDGDGHDDFVVSGDGFARVRSGATGQSLWFVANQGADDHVLILGDVNHDDCADVVVASPKETVQGAIETGVIRFYSGKTGALITTIYGGGLNQRFGSRIANAGDVNNDNRPDFLATSKVGLNGTPSVHVVAGVWNDVIMTIQPPSNASAYFASALAGGKDFNNDGFDDIVVGDLAYNAPGSSGNGRLHVYSGLNKQSLLTITGAPNSEYGAAVACVEDVNGDGRPDIAVSAPGYVAVVNGQTVKGRVQIVSGVNGAVLRTWYAPSASSVSFGQELAGIRSNYDGFGDLLIGDPSAVTQNGASGRVIVKSGDTQIGGWGNWGVGLGGAAGVPSLTADGTMAVFQQNWIFLSNSSGGPNAIPGFFFLGSSMVDLQTGYLGKLLVVPVVVTPVVVPASGLVMPFTVTDTLLAGAQFRLQAVELDPTAPKGVSFSRGMWIQLGL